MIGVLSTVSLAQTREPPAPIRPLIVKTKQPVADLEKFPRGSNKTKDLMGDAQGQLRVARPADDLIVRAKFRQVNDKPHQHINTKGKQFSLILVKVFAEPLPAAKNYKFAESFRQGGSTKLV